MGAKVGRFESEPRSQAAPDARLTFTRRSDKVWGRIDGNCGGRSVEQRPISGLFCAENCVALDAVGIDPFGISHMETYIRELESSTIPLPHWAVIIIWLIIFVSAHVLFRKGRGLSHAQDFIVTGGPRGLVKEQSVRLALVQVLFSAAIFAYASFFGGPVFAFFAGGWFVTTAVSISLNLRSILFLRALSEPDAAKGSVMLSNSLAVKDHAFHLFGVAVFCLLVGMLVAHLALFGAALILSATAFGYLRKAKAKATDLYR